MQETSTNLPKQIIILGRQPNLGLAEVESLFDDHSVNLFSESVATLDSPVNPEIINRLGGTIKIARALAVTKSKDWEDIESFVKSKIIREILDLPDGKIDFGISTYGLRISPREITNFSLKVKKIIKSHGRSIRIIPNQANSLSSAQIIHNHLTGPAGFELIIASNQNLVLFGQTLSVQNIYEYASRDQVRPKRDAKVGMLPPKLAQIMINLANPLPSSRILDPFCGTGVILQEALIMGYKVFGTDIDSRMVEYSKINLGWLEEKLGKLPERKTEIADATTNKWCLEFSSVVSETYLGDALFKMPPPDQLRLKADQINSLVTDFLKNLSSQINKGTRICIAIPAWNTQKGFLSLPLLDHLEDIGYNHMSFKTVDTSGLIYFRPDQLVARQLLVLVRK